MNLNNSTLPADANTVASLLALITDKEAFEKKLANLQELHKAASDEIAAANAASAALATATRQHAAQVADDTAAHNRNVAELAARTVATDRRLGDQEASVRNREASAKHREDNLAQREQVVQAREAEIASTRAQADELLAQANAIKADYTKRLDLFRAGQDLMNRAQA